MLNERGSWRLAPSLILIVALAGCAGVGAQEQIHGAPGEVDQKFEARGDPVEYSGVYQDQALSEYVAAVGARLVAVSDGPSLKWQFGVLDSPRPHVFATQGGEVYITRGALALLRTESHLAALLAHEISHVSAGDAARADRVNQALEVGDLAAKAASLPWALMIREVQLYVPIKVGAVLSRHDEFEADRRAVENLRRADYPRESMADVLQVLASLEAYDRRHDDSVMRASQRLAAQEYHPVYERLGMAPGSLAPGIAGQPQPLAPRLASLKEPMPNPYQRREKLTRTLWSHAAADPAFLARLEGLEFGENGGLKPAVLRIRRAQEGDTFASLAKAVPGIPDAENQLRLLNQRYPDGELEAGELVKVIE